MEKDHSGLETLELFANAPHFNKWLFESISSYCQGNILEIGSGIGNISKLLLQQNLPVTLSDLRKEYCDHLRAHFEKSSNLQNVLQIDLSLTDFENVYRQSLYQFDTVIALNVIEHIEDDKLVISNCKKLLKPNGRIIILVPAYMSLYNSFDKELGHFRRYNKKSLAELFQSQRLKIARMQYFNCAGIFGWWFTGSVMKKTIIPKNQLAIYEKFVPLFRVMDSILMKRIGLSVIAVGIKE
ncbi:MAG: class I SAM-dependent methyltransferase [Bacteroidetes bacterium]|nr:class I SAM-dependent methyltransferase [Bacteroidota bacterium]